MVTTLKHIGSCAENVTGLMGTMLSMNQEHALIDVKDPDTLDYYYYETEDNHDFSFIQPLLCYIQNTPPSFQLFSLNQMFAKWR